MNKIVDFWIRGKALDLLIQKARIQQAFTTKRATYAAIFAYLQSLGARMQSLEVT